MALTLAACSSDTQVESPPETEELVVEVTDLRAKIAIVDATVALDLADGTRVEVSTDEDGLAHFDVASLEGATLTAHDVNHELVSLIAFTELPTYDAAEPVRIRLLPFTEIRPTIRVTGAADGMGNGHGLYVGASSGDYHQGGNEYDVRVPRGEPFTLVAIEFKGWHTLPHTVHQELHAFAVVDSPALDDDATIPLDMATPVPHETLSGAFPLPPDPDSVLRQPGTYASAQVGMRSGFPSSAMGFPTLTTYDADKTKVEYELGFVRAAPDEEVFTDFKVTSTHQGIMTVSGATMAGYPGGGDHDLGLLDPPALDYPAHEIRPLQEEIAWQGNDPDLPTAVLVLLDDRSFWRIYVPAGHESVTLPQAPSSFIAEGIFGDETLDVSVAKCELGLEDFWCARYAGTSFKALHH